MIVCAQSGWCVIFIRVVCDARTLRPVLKRALKVVLEEGRAALVDVVAQPR
jgi:hypothetical protein